jgi:DNA modification methylase
MTEQSTDATERWLNDIHQGDAVETLAEMPESSVHTVMTSPPYYGLRDYEADGQIGLEDTLDEYIAELLNVAEELRRVLRSDGSWWLNLGDSFAGSGRGQWAGNDDQPKESYTPDSLPEQQTSLRRKSKMLVPHRVAIALEDSGWIVRADCPWIKPNPMPHPVKDRLHETKEFIFHLTPEPDYWFDLDAVRESHSDASFERVTNAKESGKYTAGLQMTACPREDDPEHVQMDPDDACHPNGKNPGDIFEISVKPFSDAHFAVYPPELCETPIKASCPPKVCAECGTPYERETEETPLWERDPDDIERRQAEKALERFRASDLDVEHLEAARSVGFGDGEHGDASQGSRDRVDRETRDLADEAKEVLGGYFREFVAAPERDATGWRQACSCETDATEPGIVLDPFAGAGTTALVAKDLGRRFVGIDLNPEYVAIAQKRAGVTVDEPERLLDEDEISLQSFATDGGQSSTETQQGGDSA